MSAVALQIENNDDYELPMQLLSRLKVKVLTATKPASKLEKKRLLSIINKGGSGERNGNPVKWQKEIRADRKIMGKS